MSEEQQLETMVDSLQPVMVPPAPGKSTVEALERGRQAQLQADNTITPPRLTRQQLIVQTKRDNPDMKLTSALFRECLTLNALNQEGANLARLANFLGMSKGEVRQHMLNIDAKIRQAQQAARAAAAKVAEEIRNYQPGETNDATKNANANDLPTAERLDVNTGTGEGVTQSVEVDGAAVSS
jgi:non-ribosomal peptide synthetase component F